MKKDFLKSPLAVKLILGLAAFMVCLLPLEIVRLFVDMNRWVGLALKLALGHMGVIFLFKWLRKHPADQRPAWFPGLVFGALIGGVVYLLLTGCKFILPLLMELGTWEGVINLVRVLCPACFAAIGAKFYKA